MKTTKIESEFLTLSVRQLVKMRSNWARNKDGNLSYKENRLCLTPPYQRRASWVEKEATRYIQSIMHYNGLSGITYLEKKTKGKASIFEVADARTRLSNLIDFVENKVKIKTDKKLFFVYKEQDIDYDLRHSEGLYFTDLPQEIREEILNGTIFAIVFDGDKYPGIGEFIFRLLNSCTKQMNAQERINAQWFSELTEAIPRFVSELAKNEGIAKAMNMTLATIGRMEIDRHILMGVHLLERGLYKKYRASAYAKKMAKDFFAIEGSKTKKEAEAKRLLSELEKALMWWGDIYDDIPRHYSDQVWWEYDEKKCKGKKGTYLSPPIFGTLMLVFSKLKERSNIEKSLVRDTVKKVLNKHFNLECGYKIPISYNGLFGNISSKIAKEDQYRKMEEVATEIAKRISGANKKRYIL